MISRRVSVLTFGLGLMAVGLTLSWPAAAAQVDATAFEIADRLDLVPTPQEISLKGERHDLEEWSIVAADGCLLARTGAEEINERIAGLGGKRLPVSSTMAGGNLILVAPCTHPLARALAAELSVTPEKPGQQGYVIDVRKRDGRTILAAIGSDDLGTLYAAMTIRRLIQPGAAQGEPPVLLGAKVRDWPAFKRRCFGCLEILDDSPRRIEDPAARAAAYEKEYGPYVQNLALAKVNFVSMRGLWRGLKDPKLPVYRAAIDYAARYGIQVRMVSNTSVTDYLGPDEWTNCILRKDEKYCWTAKEAHQRKARDLAELARRLNLGYLVLHCVDMGGMFDPERWSARCERCKEVYGDDHVRALVDQYRLYYETLQKVHPGCLFEAVIQPYIFVWAVPDFLDDPMAYGRWMPGVHHMRQMAQLKNPAEQVKLMTALHRQVAEGLPSDVIVTFREGGRTEFDGVCRLWQGHPVDAWYYLYRNDGWEGLWAPQARWLKTWWRDEPRDVLFTSASRPYYSFSLSELEALNNAEYAWNLHQPDAEPTFHIKKRSYLAGGREIPEYQRNSLIPRVAHCLWGRSAEPLIDLARSNISLRYLADPAAVAGELGERFDNPYQFLGEQTAALAAGREKLNALLAEVDAGEPSGLYGDIRQEFGYRSLLYLYYFVNLAAAKGEVESACVEARRLADEDQYSKAIEKIESMAARLPGLVQQVDQVKARFASDPVAERYIAQAAKGGEGEKLAKYDLAGQKARLESLRRSLAAESERGMSADQPAVNSGATTIRILTARREDRTVEHGFATLLWLRPAIESAGSVRAAVITISVVEGTKELAATDVKLRRLPVSWKAENEVAFDLGREYQGDLSVVVTIRSEDGAIDGRRAFTCSASGKIEPVLDSAASSKRAERHQESVSCVSAFLRQPGIHAADVPVEDALETAGPRLDHAPVAQVHDQLGGRVVRNPSERPLEEVNMRVDDRPGRCQRIGRGRGRCSGSDRDPCGGQQGTCQKIPTGTAIHVLILANGKPRNGYGTLPDLLHWRAAVFELLVPVRDGPCNHASRLPFPGRGC